MDRDTFFKYYGSSAFGKKAGTPLRQFASLVGYQGFLSDREAVTGRPDALHMDIEKIRKPMVHTWSYMGYDVISNAKWNQEHGDPTYKLTNIMAIEVILDQDHMEGCANDNSPKVRERELAEVKAANQEIDSAMDRWGYDAVLRYLAAHIQLV